MFDSIVSTPRIMSLHPSLRVDALDTIEDVESLGVTIRVTYGLRTFDEQNALYQKGRTLPGNIVTNAKAGFSFHNYGLALDFCLLHRDKMWSWDMKEDMNKDGKADWLQVVEVFKTHGWEAGYDWTKFPDPPHFQKTFGLDIQECFNRYRDGNLEHGYILIN